MPTAPISTNPLDASLEKIMGSKTPKKETDPLSPISYGDDTTFRPGADTITVSGNPATGATTAEEWTHGVQLEELRQKALEQEYQERAAAEAAAFEAQQAALVEANRQAQLGLSRSAEARAGQETALGLEQTRQQMELARGAEQRAQMDQALKMGGVFTPEQLATSTRALTFRNAITPGGMGRPSAGAGSYERLYGAADYATPIGPTAQNPSQQYGFAIPGAYVGSTQGYSPGYVGFGGGNAYYQPYGSGMSQSLGKPGSESFNQSMYALNPANQVGAGVNWSNYYAGKKGINT